MQSIICPLDNTPCDPECPDRFHDTEEGGCILTLAAEMGCRVLYLDNVAENTYSLRDLFPDGGDTP